MPLGPLEKNIQRVRKYFPGDTADILSNLILRSQQVMNLPACSDKIRSSGESKKLVEAISTASTRAEHLGLAVMLQLYETTNGPNSSLLLGKLDDPEGKQFSLSAQQIRMAFLDALGKKHKQFLEGALGKAEMRDLLTELSQVPTLPLDPIFQHDTFDDAVDVLLGFDADDRNCCGNTREELLGESIGYVATPGRKAILVSKITAKYGCRRLIDGGCGRFRFGAIYSQFSDDEVVGQELDPQHVERGRRLCERLRLTRCSLQQKNILSEDLELRPGDAYFLYTPFHGDQQAQFIEHFLRSKNCKSVLVIAYDQIRRAFDNVRFEGVKDFPKSKFSLFTVRR